MILDKVKELFRGKIAEVHLYPGDTLALTYTAPNTTVVLAKHSITPEQAMTVDEAVLLECEVDGRRAMGGLVLEKEAL